MRGIVFRGERELELVEVPDPIPGPNEVVIRMEASGMCGSDLHLYRGPRSGTHGKIGGHEPAGVIEKVGPGVPDRWVGRSVLVHHYFGCGACDQCHAGWTQLCRGRAGHGQHRRRIAL